MITALHNTQLITGGTIVSGKAILIEGKHIKAIIDAKQIPGDVNRIDLDGAYTAPGLIDLQIYGAGTKLFGGNPSVGALAEMEDVLLKQGTTGFLATIATNSDEVVLQGIDAAKHYIPKAKGNFLGLHLEGPYLNPKRKGNFLGLHLEGPYLNPKRKGAHPENYIKKATLSELKSRVERGEGVIKMMTIAPELQDDEVLEYLSSQNIIISAGHTDATYEQASSFLNNPVTAATHLFNAMPQMHHREPGIIPAVFEQRPYTSIVADGVHVSFPMIALAKRELGDRLFFITDAVTVANKGAYQHQLKGDRYVMPDGTLSGSALTMLKAVKNGVKKVGISLPEAINMASLYPAQLASLAKKGKIEAGYFADLIIFNDSFTVATTVLQGEIVYNTNQ